MSCPVYAKDPRALARNHPLTIASNPPVAFIATQDPTPAELQALGGHSVRASANLAPPGTSEP